MHTEVEIKDKLQMISTDSNALKKQATILLSGKTGTLLSSGYNYHPESFGQVNHKNTDTYEYRERLPRPMHSEVVAILDYLKTYKRFPDEKMFLYTTNLPCAGCAEIINLVGIKNIRYVNDFDNNYGELILLKSGIDIKKF